MRSYFSCAPIVVCAIASFITAGCGGGFSNSSLTGPQANVGTILGVVHGGQQPVSGSHVYLYAAGTTGYGAASKSLLGPVPGVTAADASGNYYVTSDAGGNFSVTGDYTCTTGSQVYLYAVGGNAGAGPNPAAGFLAVLGQCPASGTLAGNVPQIGVSEISTVAAAFALAGFATDPTHISSSGTALAQTGIANAFANTSNLVSKPTGASFSTTPAGNGTVPQAEINTLGNILAACVNSNGPSSNPCSLLFLSAMSNGSSGIAPTDTAGAAINIAHNPGDNVQFLYYLQAGTAAPFQPSLASAPNDFTIALSFTGGGMGNNAGLAVDGAGNAWTIASNNTALSKLSPLGAPLSTPAGFVTGMTSTSGLVIDTSNRPIVSGLTALNGTISLYSSSGSLMHTDLVPTPLGLAVDGFGSVYFGAQTGCPTTCFQVYRLSNGTLTASGNNPAGYSGPPTFIALDGLGAGWISSANSTLSKLDASLNPAAGPFTRGLFTPYNLAVDAASNVWVANAGNSTLAEFSSAGLRISGANGYAGGGLSGPRSVAIDGVGNVWAANYTGNSLSAFQSNGQEISNTGYLSSTLSNPNNLAIDGSGDIWVGNATSASLTEFIGAAAPVVTPLSTAAATNTLGTRP